MSVNVAWLALTYKTWTLEEAVFSVACQPNWMGHGQHPNLKIDMTTTTTTTTTMMVMMMIIIKGQGRIIGPVFNSLASFSIPINHTNNVLNRAIWKFEIEISNVKVMGEVNSGGYIAICDLVTSSEFSWLVTSDLTESPILSGRDILCTIAMECNAYISKGTRPTLNADKLSATLDPWSIMSPNNHLSFSKSYMLSVHEAIKISYSYHLAYHN